MSIFDPLAVALVSWVYPANRPSLLPFEVRKALIHFPILGLLALHKLGRWLDRGIGGVAPDVAKRGGMERGDDQ